MISELLETTTETATAAAGPQQPGALSRFLSDPIYPAWAAAIFALVILIPEGIKAGRWLRRRWETRHLPRNTQVHEDRANYVRLLDKYEAYLTLLRNLLIIRSQTIYGNVADNPEVSQKMVELREELYRNLERQGDEESEMGDLQKLDILEDRNVGIDDLRERRQELEELQAEIENHPLFIQRDSDE